MDYVSFLLFFSSFLRSCPFRPLLQNVHQCPLVQLGTYIRSSPFQASLVRFGFLLLLHCPEACRSSLSVSSALVGGACPQMPLHDSALSCCFCCSVLLLLVFPDWFLTTFHRGFLDKCFELELIFSVKRDESMNLELWRKNLKRQRKMAKQEIPKII